MPWLDSAALMQRWRNLEFRSKLGIMLVVTANLLLAAILLVPFLDVDLKTKGIISLVLFVVGEILFYTGLFLVGKEVVAKYRKYFNPGYWWKINKKQA